MQLKTFVESSIPQYLLACAMAAAMTFMLGTCFYVDPALQFNVVLVVCCVAVLMALLFVASYSKTTAVVGVVCFVALAVGMVVYMHATSSTGFLDDDPANPVPYMAVLVGTVLAVFLLSRKQWGALVLFVGGTILAALVQYLYHWWLYAPFVVYICASITMCFFRSYLDAFMASSARKTSFAPAFATGLVICLVVTGLGTALFFGVIARFDPPSRDIKLITRYMKLPTEEVHGISQYKFVVDRDKRSSNLMDDTVKSSTKGTKRVEKESDDAPSGIAALGDMAGAAVGYAVNGAKKMFDPVSYEPNELYLLLLRILLLVLLLCLPYLLKKLWRWFLVHRMRDWAPAEQVQWLYRYYLRKLDVLKLGKPECDTPGEYAVAVGPYVDSFERNDAHVGIAGLTQIFEGAAYGNSEVSTTQLDTFKKFHARFYRNCMSYLGPIKYFFRFLRL